MPIDYLNNQSGDIGAINSMGQSMNGIAFALPQLKLQAEQFRQRIALQRAQQILRDAQTKEAQQHGDFFQAEAEGARGKEERAKNIAVAAQALGLNRAQQYQAGRPPMGAPSMENAQTMATMQALQNAFVATGDRPDRGEDFARQNIADVATQQDPYMQQLIASKTKLPGPTNLAPGHTMVPGVGDPRPQYTAPPSPVALKSFALRPGQIEYDPTGKPLATNNITANPNLGNLATAAFNALRPQEQQGYAPQILGKVGMTNAAPQQAQQPVAKGPPKPGTVMKGYRFKGGDPSKKENWEKVQ